METGRGKKSVREEDGGAVFSVIFECSSGEFTRTSLLLFYSSSPAESCKKFLLFFSKQKQRERGMKSGQGLLFVSQRIFSTNLENAKKISNKLFLSFKLSGVQAYCCVQITFLLIQIFLLKCVSCDFTPLVPFLSLSFPFALFLRSIGESIRKGIKKNKLISFIICFSFNKTLRLEFCKKQVFPGLL